MILYIGQKLLTKLQRSSLDKSTVITYTIFREAKLLLFKHGY